MTSQGNGTDRSPEAVAARKKSTDQARAMNMRQGYVWDPVLEELTALYVAGDITIDEYRERGLPKAIDEYRERGLPKPR
ncbi:MAG: hypothetical protein P0Y65_12265 [Candidatus Devosia phytovorans]|uniref:Antitoxin VbhA domain-containing protein n=1 Tax=Candidatus Devosia phytovorans TaxID=3121372 RepID=A0AAJ5VQN8_9HYPH|nr:hypothetical protein [Devosia sp.]WEK02981.1 MAG: hypothetical protein P0Y65_12265 [Devosia sp.]